MQVFVALQSTHIEQRWRGINLKKNQNQTQQIKETERKGVERAKEKLKKYTKHMHTCVQVHVHRHTEACSPHHPDVRAEVQLFLIHSIERL